MQTKMFKGLQCSSTSHLRGNNSFFKDKIPHSCLIPCSVISRLTQNIQAAFDQNISFKQTGLEKKPFYGLQGKVGFCALFTHGSF